MFLVTIAFGVRSPGASTSGGKGGDDDDGNSSDANSSDGDDNDANQHDEDFEVAAKKKTPRLVLFFGLPQCGKSRKLEELEKSEDACYCDLEKLFPLVNQLDSADPKHVTVELKEALSATKRIPLASQKTSLPTILLVDGLDLIDDLVTREDIKGGAIRCNRTTMPRTSQAKLRVPSLPDKARFR